VLGFENEKRCLIFLGLNMEMIKNLDLKIKMEEKGYDHVEDRRMRMKIDEFVKFE